MENPNQELAEIILKQLVNEKLLNANQSKRISDKLVAGKLKQEDWLSAIELSLTEKGQANG